MSISDADLDAIDTAAVKNAQRGVRGITIGDRRIDYSDTKALLEAKRMLREEENGGEYSIEFAPKGHY